MKKNIIVIGSGPGGYVAAIRLAQLGNQVTIIEKDLIGGCCLNVGCIPSKALIHLGHELVKANGNNVLGISTESVKFDFTKGQTWKDNQVVKPLTKGIESLLIKNKVKILRGEAKFVSDKQISIGSETLVFDACIIATGSSPIRLKNFPLSEKVVDSTGLLALNEVPKRLVVLGGGYIGSELANAYHNLGSKVTILEGSERILPNFDKKLTSVIETHFKQIGLDVIPNAMAESYIDNESLKVSYKLKDKVETIETDCLLVSVGRTPNSKELGLENTSIKVNEKGFIITNEFGETSAKYIYALGDVVEGPALAHKASFEAKTIAETISGKPYPIKYKAIPAVCFTDIEIASTGIDVSMVDLKTQRVDQFPYQANGRSLSVGATQGFVRIISDKNSRMVLGAQIVGNQASDLIAQITLAIENDLNLEDISMTIHPHPSTAEIIMDAAELALDLPIHM